MLQFKLNVLNILVDVQWEGDCKYESATIRQFSDWLKGDCSEDNPLHLYSTDLYWCYADYKYMADVFKERPDILKVIIIFKCLIPCSMAD